VTTALRLLVAELVALTVGGTLDSLRDRAPLLWNAKSLIDQASAVHAALLKFWPGLGRLRQEGPAGSPGVDRVSWRWPGTAGRVAGEPRPR
jgi:hypothetical protein